MAVIAVAVSAVELIERFADEQALARVNLAGASAEEAVERSARDVRTSALLLSERPTVRRLLAERDAAGLTAFLDRFRQTSALSGVAVFSGGRRFAAVGASLPWDEVLSRGGGETRTVIVRLPDGALLLSAASPLAAASGSTPAAALVLDDGFARQTAGQVGLPVATLDAEQALADPNDPRMPLRAEALATGTPASGRLKEAGLYLSVRPLRTPSGEVAALVETELPRDLVASSLARMVRNLLLLALLVAALATLSGFLISRRLTRPVQELTASAARIGRGDLSTPAPRAPGAELGTLAATMEEMRRRLLQLTSELRRRQAEGEAGYLVVEAADGQAALETFERESPALVILDVNLPRLSGLEVCRRIRQESNVPIMMLTVRNAEEDQVQALDMGADDYLNKPFSPRTLSARVRALLRRAGDERPAPLAVGDFSLDLELQSVSVRGGEPVRLTKLELRLLQILLANAGHTLPAERLLAHVWGSRGSRRTRPIRGIW